MKLHRISLAVLTVSGLLVLASTSFAQNTNSTARPERRGPNIKQRVERLSTELNLTADQKTKLTALFEKELKEGRELREDTSVSKEERREKWKALRQAQDKELKTILTSEQLEKYKEMREKMRERRQGGAGQPGEAAPKPEPKNPDSGK